MFAKINSAVPRGVEALRVQVEVDARPGLPALAVVGLPDPAVREARERVLAAIRHLGCRIDTKSIVVNLSPAEERKEGALLDLAIAGGVLSLLSPHMAWTIFEGGWRYKNVEPSDAYLVFSRIGGVVLIVVGVLLLFGMI